MMSGILPARRRKEHGEVAAPITHTNIRSRWDCFAALAVTGARECFCLMANSRWLSPRCVVRALALRFLT